MADRKERKHSKPADQLFKAMLNYRFEMEEQGLSHAQICADMDLLAMLATTDEDREEGRRDDD